MADRRPFNATLLIVLMSIFSVIGLVSGLIMLADPSGGILGLPEDIIDSLPVDDLFLVGLWLFLAFGLYPAILSYGLVRRPIWSWTEPLNGWTGMHWSWSGSALLVILLYIWLVVEALLIGFEAPVQYITLILTLVLTFLCLAPCVRAYYWEKPGPFLRRKERA